MDPIATARYGMIAAMNQGRAGGGSEGPPAGPQTEAARTARKTDAVAARRAGRTAGRC
jgi:hypothetical protein